MLLHVKADCPFNFMSVADFPSMHIMPDTDIEVSEGLASTLLDTGYFEQAESADAQGE